MALNLGRLVKSIAKTTIATSKAAQAELAFKIDNKPAFGKEEVSFASLNRMKFKELGIPWPAHDESPSSSARNILRAAIAAYYTPHIRNLWNTEDCTINVGGPNARTISLKSAISGSESLSCYQIQNGLLYKESSDERQQVFSSITIGGSFEGCTLIGVITNAQTQSDCLESMKTMFDIARKRIVDIAYLPPRTSDIQNCNGIVCQVAPYEYGVRIPEPYVLYEHNADASSRSSMLSNIIALLTAADLVHDWNEKITIMETGSTEDGILRTNDELDIRSLASLMMAGPSSAARFALAYAAENQARNRFASAAQPNSEAAETTISSLCSKVSTQTLRKHPLTCHPVPLRRKQRSGLTSYLLPSIGGLGWTAGEVSLRMERAFSMYGIRARDYNRFRMWDSDRNELVNLMHDIIERSDTRAKERYSLEERYASALDLDFYLSPKQKRAADKIRAGELTMRILCDFLGTSVPEGIAGTVLENERIERNLAFYGTQVREKCVFFDWERSHRDPIALQNHHSICIITAKPERFEGCSVPVLQCASPGAVSILVSSLLRSHYDALCIGITGSVGKTTTTMMLNHVAAKKYVSQEFPGHGNRREPIALNACALKEKTTGFVQEMEGGRVKGVEVSANMMRPSYFVVTNIGNAHIENHGGDRLSILYGKLAMDRHSAPHAIGFVNGDDDLLSKAPYCNEIRTFAIQKQDADFRAVNIIQDDETLRFDIEERNGTRTPINIQARGEHNAYDALAAFAVGVEIGVDRPTIANSINRYRSNRYRQNLITIAGRQVYLDCYNSVEMSVKSALDAIATVKVPEGSRKIAIFGDLLKIGSETEAAHRRIGKLFADYDGVDEIILFGSAMAFAMEEASNPKIPIRRTEDYNELLTWMRNTNPGDLVSLKGYGRRVGLFKLLDELFGTAMHVISIPGTNTPVIKSDGLEYKAIEDYGSVITKADASFSGDIPERLGDMPLRAIYNNAFEESNIQEIVLPPTVRTIGSRAFAGCRNLRKITLSSSLDFVDSKAFADCTSLEEIVFPEGVRTIGKEACSGCTSLRHAVLPKSLLTTGDDIFRGCTALENNEFTM